MASGPITSWQIDEEIMETVTYFNFLGSKITADGACSHEIKRCLLLGRKAMPNLDNILKSRDITLLTKFHLVNIGMWELDHKESWAPKNDVSQLRCWRRCLRVPWTERRCNQSILKISLNIHREDWCWSWSSNTLATWCKVLTHRKRPWCWERLKAGGKGDNRAWDSLLASSARWTWVWASCGSWWWTGKPGVLQSTGLQKVRHNEWLNWTECSCSYDLSGEFPSESEKG